MGVSLLGELGDLTVYHSQDLMGAWLAGRLPCLSRSQILMGVR